MTDFDRFGAVLPPRSMGRSAYDSAWVASLRNPADLTQPRFPRSFDWLLRNQLTDGSWGGALQYQHDRLLATLSALRCLTRFPGRDQVDTSIRRAQHYIWRHAHELRSEPCELVGFELLIPTLLRDVTRAHISLPPYLDAYAAERSHKLSLIPKDLLYSPNVTLVHSLEFLGDDGDPSRLLQTVNKIGSVGNSPAATAYLLDKVECPAALEYLRACLATDPDGAATVTYPCENFDMLWSAYHHLLSDERKAVALVPEHVFAEFRSKLASGEGISFSATFPIPDADDTAVAIALLCARGEPVSPLALQQFAKSEYYTSYEFERHPSIGVNVHILDALDRLPPAPVTEQRIQQLLGFIAETRKYGIYWIDKWHISPYYATGHTVAVLAGLRAPHNKRAAALCPPALEWIRATQREDGSWGYYKAATSEETAYAVLALTRAPALREPGDDERIRRGASYIKAQLAESGAAELPPLWIDKTLYYPARIVQALFASVLHLAEQLEGCE